MKFSIVSETTKTANGSVEEKPAVKSINDALYKKQYYASGDISIWFDDIQELWQWRCDVEDIPF